MKINRKTILAVLGILALIFLVGLSYLNKSIFMEQILLSAFIIGLTTLVHNMGGIKNMGQKNEEPKRNY